MTKLTTALCTSLLLVTQTSADQTQVDRYLQLTEPAKSSPTGRLQAFENVFRDLEPAGLEDRIEQAYAKEFYFNDTFITVSRRKELIEYLTNASNNANFVNTTILDVAQSGDDLYIRWLLEMEFDVMGKPRYSRTLGMTHLRFDHRGLIVLHQDFWDSAAGFYQHVPVLGSMISWVKRKMHR